MNTDIKVSELKHRFDKDFTPSQEYLKSMPDLQNSDFVGEPINFVGIHDFKLPIRIEEKSGGSQEVTASISGTVSLDALNRGINMSRIIRTFYKSKDDIFNIDRLGKVLENYCDDLDSFEARILMNFEYRIWQEALRSVKENGEKEGGWQFYNITFDAHMNKKHGFKKVMWIDFVYSSACPCSTALSEHAAYSRGVYGIPHSQRSVARIGIAFEKLVWIEDVIEACRKALNTETLVFCKRQDEQAFAEANGANPKFVEDAIRFLSVEIDKLDGVYDYKIICSHLESLHSHNAIAVKIKGVSHSSFNSTVTIDELKSLVR